MSIILSELVELNSRYNVPDLPVYIVERKLSDFRGNKIDLHKNEDMELLRIVSGSMNAEVEGVTYPLKKDDFLFINQGRIHELTPAGADCCFVCLLINARVFHHEIVVGEKLIREFLSPRSPACCYLPASDSKCREITWFMDYLLNYKNKNDTILVSYMEYVGILHLIMARLYPMNREPVSAGAEEREEEKATLNRILTFLYGHYAEKLTLREIASAGNVSRTTCCQLFKKYVGIPPIEFLNRHRLSVSSRMLCETQNSVADIAAACGFSHQSYFTKQFVQRYRCTPREYRAKLQ